MRRKRTVQLIQLLARGGGHGDGHAQVLAALAFAQLDRGGIKRGVELVGDVGDGVHQSDPSFDATTVELRESKGGKYLGMTITVTATSREQLDELYRTLSTHPMVKVVL